MKKIIIAGGTGFIGHYLKTRLEQTGYQVCIVSRLNGDITWNPNELTAAMNEADAVINLAGKSINCRHTAENKEEILSSRIKATQAIGKAIQRCTTPPKLWINASATGIYKSDKSHPCNEYCESLGNGFLAEVVQHWEKAQLDFELPDTRMIQLRTSVVLGKKGGALKPLTCLTAFLLGGKQAGGKQMFSWIHIEDYFRIVVFLLRKNDINGVVNVSSPYPVTNAEFMFHLRDAVGIPFGLPIPKWLLAFANKFIKTDPDILWGSSNIYPARLVEAGFEFSFPKIGLALEDLN